LVKEHEILEVWKIRNKKIIHKPTNQGQSMNNKPCVTLQEMLNEIKLIGEEIEICQIDHTISTHGDTNALSINTMILNPKTLNPKQRNKLSNKKSSKEIKSEASATATLKL
jgi:hypothetical protein